LDPAAAGNQIEAAAAAAAATDTVRRVRGIARKAHRHLDPAHFSQDPSCNVAVVRTTTMRPTVGGNEMFMSRESKTLANTLNVYRSMLVREKLRAAAHPSSCVWFFLGRYFLPAPFSL
jgi:hypothetical protein